MAQIFVSYRRADTEAVASHLAEDLAERFGADSVFSDFDGIRAGASWQERLDEALDAAQCVLILIGRRWLTVRSEGRRRLDDEHDQVRREVAGALRRVGDTKVIPVLVDEEKMPAREKLPPDIADLAGLQALHIRNREWREDFTRLLREIEPGREGSSVAGERVRRPWYLRHRRIALGGLALAAGIVAALVIALSGDSGPDRAEVAYATRVEGLLGKSAMARVEVGKVASAMQDAADGNPAMSGPEMQRRLELVKANRLDMINRANALRPPSADAREVQSALIRAFTASRSNNDQLDNCLPRPPPPRPRITKSCLAAAGAGDARATSAKEKFTKLYVKLRDRLGMTPTEHNARTF
jgi:hypothetical protein